MDTPMRKARKNKGLTLKELGKKIGVAESTVSLYESGARQPGYETLVRIADILEVSTDYLLGRTKLSAPVDEIAAASVSNGGTYADLTPENLEAIEQVKDILRNLPELKIKKE